MAYFRGDISSAGLGEHRFTGHLFPRTDIHPSGAWVEVDCNADGTVYAATSSGERHELGPRAPDNPICVRWIEARQVFKVAWIDHQLGGHAIDFDVDGRRIPKSDALFDGTGAGSQGILDIDPHGTILFKDGHDVRMVDGLPLLHWRERGHYIVGVMTHTWLGVVVYELPSGHWYRAFESDVQLLPGIAANGTVVANGEGGGYIPRAEWVTRPFDPHQVTAPPPASLPGWYCDQTPAGQWVALVPNQHLIFNGATVPLPAGQNVLCVRIAPDGSKFAGIGHQDDQAWQWDGAQWTAHGLAFGPRSVMYGADNQLLTISGPGTPAGSQGMRYLDDRGQVVYSHETYADPQRAIWEYTERGAATLGQGGDSRYGADPAVILLHGIKRVIEEGTCRFINAYRQGDVFTVAYVREDANLSVFRTFTVAEAETFPVFVGDAPHTDAPHTDAPHTDAPHTDAPVHNDAPSHDDLPPIEAEDMNHNLVLVDKKWHHVEEIPHPDAGADHGPVVGVRRIGDGHMLKVRHDGKVEFEEGSPGADERLIPVPGGFAALREVHALVHRAGPWTA